VDARLDPVRERDRSRSRRLDQPPAQTYKDIRGCTPFAGGSSHDEGRVGRGT
jgi:hypothetical protein